MSDYIRPSVTGARVFFTVAMADRGSDLLVREIDLLRQAVRETRRVRPFGIDPWVVLPDHLHCVWTLPVGDADFATRWGAIKARFTMSLREAGPETADGDCGRTGFSPASGIATELPVVRSGKYAGLKPGLRVRKRERAVWQRRFWEHHIRDDADFAAHVRYCWGDPVRHGLVARPVDWPFSSIHRHIRMGQVEPDWAATDEGGTFGE